MDTDAWMFGKNLFVVADPDADILYEASTVRGDNIVTILPETAPALYLEYLQKKGISYLFADASSYSRWLSKVYALKGRLLKNLLVYFAKNRRFNVFFIDSLRTEGKRQKQPFGSPTDLVYKDRACRGLFRQNGV